MKSFLFASLTQAINAYLHLDPASSKRFAKLRGKAIAIQLLPLSFTFQCVFNESGVVIHADESIICDTTLRGTPLQMLGVMLTAENRHRFFADDLTMEGDAAIGQQVIDLFDHLDIDWENYLSQLIGDVPAYQAGRFIRGVTSWFSTVNENLTQDINDYLHEETRWLPTREALHDFFTDVDALRMDMDRMDVRVKRLQHTLNEGNNL